MNGINLEKNFALTSSCLVQEICDPLLKSIGITYFNFIKIYNNDCSRELLTNNADWIEHFYSKALYNSIGAIDIEHLLPKGYFLWAEMDTKDPIYLQGRDFFNIDHGITFVIKRQDVTLLYIFATDRTNHEINNFYASNIDLLQRFIHYFTDKGHDLIKSAEDHRIYLPTPQEIIATRINNITVSDKVRAEFFENSHVSRYFLLNESDDLYLTKKQGECASLLINGQTSKQIARNMSISPRTVEGYISDIRNKLCESLNKPLNKDQIIQILRGSNIR